MTAGNALNATLIGLTTVTVRAVEGIDQPGRGSDIRPYKTIAYALSHTTFVANTMYLFDCFGSFTETLPALVPNLIFSGNGGSLKVNNSVSLDALWSGVSGTLMFNGFSTSLDFSAGLSLNFSSSPSSMFKIQNCFITKEVAGWTLTGNASNQNLYGLYIDYLPGMAPSITATNMIFLNSNTIISASSPLVLTGTALSITQASATVNGYLSSIDWLTFNAKQPAGSYLTALTGDVTAAGPGSSAATITAGAVTNTKLANMIDLTFKANLSGVVGPPQDVTVSQMQAALGISSSVSLQHNFVGFGSALNALTGSSDLTWDGSTLSVNGDAKITGLNSIGVVHNDSAGNLTTSLIVANDITNLTITGAKIAASTITGAKIAASTVSNSNLATMAANTFKANSTGSAANPSDISIATAQGMLGLSGGLTIGNTQIGFGNSSGDLIGSSDFTWNDLNNVLSLVGGSEINLGVSTSSRKVVLYSASANAFQYYGFGVAGGVLEYTVDAAASDHVFYAGLTTTTRQELFRIKGNKTITTQSGGGIQFGNSTTSYSPATLDYCEGPFTVTMSLSGPWASPIPFPVTFYRLGKNVSMQWAGMNAGVARTNSAIIVSQSGSNNIPARFGTSALSGFTKPIRIIDGSTNSSLDVGGIALSNGGGGLFLTITPAANVTFSNAFCGVPAGEITWQFA